MPANLKTSGFFQRIPSAGSKHFFIFACALAGLIFSSGALAVSLATVRNPRTFSMNYQSMAIKSVAFSCLAWDNIPDDLPCQPAFLPLQKKPRFVANGLISNGYQSFAKARRLLANDIDAEFMNGLFTQDKILEVEANASMHFLSQYVSAKYLLYGLQYYSTQRNQANPQLEMYAAESKQWVVQTGYPISQMFLVGLQLRSQSDKIVNKAFRLTELGTDSGKELLKPKEYSRLLAEPGVALNGSNWKLSVLGANLLVDGDNTEEIEEKPEAQVGASYEFPAFSGKMDLSVDYKSLSYTEDPDQKLHWGARYQYGVLSLLGGVDSWGLSGGLFFSIEKIYSGILYSTSQVPWRKSEEYAQTTYIELGWQL